MLSALVVLAAYLLGSVPVGVLVSRRLGGVDIRSQGSGNIGTANVMRVSGWRAGVIVMILDILKGVLPVAAAGRLGLPGAAAAAAGLAAVAGHNWSPFLGFRGGKGVATSLGVVIAFSPVAALVLFVIWVAIVAATRYSSLGSITALLLCAPVMSWAGGPPEGVAFALAATLIGLWRHRQNVVRLLQGREHKITQRSGRTQA